MTEKAIWLTDIHLEFLGLNDRKEFIKSLKNRKAKNVFITGDIGNYKVTEEIMPIISQTLPGKNILYVLGNHDFYNNDAPYPYNVDSARGRLSFIELSKTYYLTQLVHPYQITDDTSVIGHDSWYDAEAGDYWNTNFGTNDFNYITGFRWGSKKERFKLIQELSIEGVNHIRNKLELLKTKNVIILMHVPPFIESSRYNGKVSEPDAAPYFCCPTMGKMLYEYADSHKDKHITVLCGHTHEKYEYQPLKNLIVKTGGATYGQPEVQEIISIK